MLAMVPYSFLTDHDIWFGDPAATAAVQGVTKIDSYAALRNLSTENRDAFGAAYTPIAMNTRWRNLDSAPFLGFDAWMFDRSVFTDTPPPWSFSVDQGHFNAGQISNKLAEQGYSKVDYGLTSYYSIRGDSQIDFNTDLGKTGIMASMNRVMVTNNSIVTSTTTDAMTQILDAAAGKGASVGSSDAGKALTASLGDVLSGVIMNPQRVLNVNPPQEVPPFYFSVPAGWGILHQYDMVGMGYKNDGNASSWIISLYYKDPAAASADAAILPVRLKSYILNSQTPKPETAPDRFLSDRYSVGEPVVQRFSTGVTLTIECKGNPWPSTLLLGLRDLLFLAPDPAPYVTASQPPSNQSPIKPTEAPTIFSKPVFSNFATISVGAQEGYNDLTHQKITVHVSITNQSAPTVKNVRVTVSTLATNYAQKPLLLEAQSQTAGHLDFAPGESETYDISWNYDGSTGSKSDTANLVSQTIIEVKFTDQNGGQQKERLFPNTPLPSITP
jgi:hypothetical protein